MEFLINYFKANLSIPKDLIIQKVKYVHHRKNG